MISRPFECIINKLKIADELTFNNLIKRTIFTIQFLQIKNTIKLMYVWEMLYSQKKILFESFYPVYLIVIKINNRAQIAWLKFPLIETYRD